MEIITIQVPLYGQTIEIVITEDFNSGIEELKIDNDTKFNLNEREAFMANQYDKIWLFIRLDAKPGIIAHECVHICNYIFQEANIKLDLDNDEPYAYLMGWVVEEIHKAIKK